MSALALAGFVPASDAHAQRSSLPEVKIRWDRLCQIRKEKFDHILPEAMRENGIDMWIVAQKEGHDDPLAPLLGGGYTGSVGYYVFTDTEAIASNARHSASPIITARSVVPTTSRTATPTC
ncbi:MAG: hypothetical protein U5K74_09460 [Gemmatimonadaceae bacterium]|nr:hypothetical protein [Gemmatimonadaceae bacterium]